MSWRIVIADDEPPARDRLRRLLTLETDLAVVAECSTGDEAVTFVRARQPDIAILDIAMPGLSGLEAARSLVDRSRPVVILVSAHAAPRTVALPANVVDYILKPYSPARLRRALDQAKLRCLDRRARAGAG